MLDGAYAVHGLGSLGYVSVTEVVVEMEVSLMV